MFPFFSLKCGEENQVVLYEFISMLHTKHTRHMKAQGFIEMLFIVICVEQNRKSIIGTLWVLRHIVGHGREKWNYSKIWTNILKVQINSLTYLYEKDSLSCRTLFLIFVKFYVCSLWLLNGNFNEVEWDTEDLDCSSNWHLYHPGMVRWDHIHSGTSHSIVTLWVGAEPCSRLVRADMRSYAVSYLVWRENFVL